MVLRGSLLSHPRVLREMTIMASNHEAGPPRHPVELRAVWGQSRGTLTWPSHQPPTRAGDGLSSAIEGTHCWPGFRGHLDLPAWLPPSESLDPDQAAHPTPGGRVSRQLSCRHASARVWTISHAQRAGPHWHFGQTLQERCCLEGGQGEAPGAQVSGSGGGPGAEGLLWIPRWCLLGSPPQAWGELHLLCCCGALRP